MTMMQTEFETRGRTWTDRMDELMEFCEQLAIASVGFRVAPSVTGWVISRL